MLILKWTIVAVEFIEFCYHRICFIKDTLTKVILIDMCRWYCSPHCIPTVWIQPNQYFPGSTNSYMHFGMIWSTWKVHYLGTYVSRLTHSCLYQCKTVARFGENNYLKSWYWPELNLHFPFKYYQNLWLTKSFSKALPIFGVMVTAGRSGVAKIPH